jgi:Zn-dependent protease
MRYKLVLFLAVVTSVVLHELGHAASALAFGDDTAQKAGRITLNPWKINPFGAVILPALLVVIGGFPIAFASTPVSPRKMRNPRLHSLLCSLAGPAVNIVLIAASIAVLRGHASVFDQFGPESTALPLPYLVAYAFGYINVILAVFNLIPIPPLDGSALIERFLPRTWWPGWITFRQYGMGVLILVVFALPGVLHAILHPVLNYWASSAALPIRFL